MSFGISVTNAAGRSVIDADSLCLHFSGSPSVSTNTTLDGFGDTLYGHTLNDTADEFLFLKSESTTVINGSTQSVVMSSSPNISNTYVDTNVQSLSYIRAKKPTNASGYGFAVYDESGNLTYTASENLLNIKTSASFVTYNQGYIIGYPTNIENILGYNYTGVRFYGFLPYYSFTIPKTYNYVALSGGSVMVSSLNFVYYIRRCMWRQPITGDDNNDIVSIFDVAQFYGPRFSNIQPLRILAGNPDIFMVFVSI